MLEPDEVQAVLGLHRSTAQTPNEAKARWAKGEKRLLGVERGHVPIQTREPRRGPARVVPWAIPDNPRKWCPVRVLPDIEKCGFVVSLSGGNALDRPVTARSKRTPPRREICLLGELCRPKTIESHENGIPSGCYRT